MLKLANILPIFTAASGVVNTKEISMEKHIALLEKCKFLAGRFCDWKVRGFVVGSFEVSRFFDWKFQGFVIVSFKFS